MGYPSVLQGGVNNEIYNNVVELIDDIKAKVKENTGNDVHEAFLKLSGINYKGETIVNDPTATFQISTGALDKDKEPVMVTVNGLGIDMKSTWDTMLDEAYGITNWVDDEEIDSAIADDDIYSVVDGNGEIIGAFDSTGVYMQLTFDSEGKNYYDSIWGDFRIPINQQKALANTISVIPGASLNDFPYVTLVDGKFDTMETHYNNLYTLCMDENDENYWRTREIAAEQDTGTPYYFDYVAFTAPYMLSNILPQYQAYKDSLVANSIPLTEGADSYIDSYVAELDEEEAEYFRNNYRKITSNPVNLWAYDVEGSIPSELVPRELDSEEPYFQLNFVGLYFNNDPNAKDYLQFKDSFC